MVLNGYWSRLGYLQFCLLTKSQDIEEARQEATEIVINNLTELIYYSGLVEDIKTCDIMGLNKEVGE